MLAYFELRQLEPSDEELKIIKKLDFTAMTHYQEQAAKASKSKTKS